MGQGPSKAETPAAKESLYDLLQVDRTAGAQELKVAYRKIALQLHPDRNFGRTDEATAQFAKVQAAYDILSDENERKWYDEHEDSFGYHEYSARVTRTNEILAYQDPAYVRTLDPSKDKFYRSAMELFERLKHEEMEAGFEQGIDVALNDAPAFGGIDTAWPQVKRFYDVWTSFSTIKTFSWEDAYPVHQAPDRKTKRNFEKQNSRIREAAKRDFNKAVRSLVVNVRAIDVRYQRQKTTREQETKKKAEAAAAASKAQRSTTGEYKEQEWTKANVEDLDAVESLECIACEEEFASAAALRDHELTPRHTRAVHELRKAMQQEDKLFSESKPKPKPKPKQPARNPEPEDDLPDVGALSVEDIMNQMDTHKKGRTRVAPPKESKAKQKRKQKNAAAANIVLNCGTCQMEFNGSDALQEHKRLTRH